MFEAHYLGIAFLLTCYLPARVEGEGGNDQTCCASPTWPVFKLICVAKMGHTRPFWQASGGWGQLYPSAFMVCLLCYLWEQVDSDCAVGGLDNRETWSLLDSQLAGLWAALNLLHSTSCVIRGPEQPLDAHETCQE